MAHFNVIPLWYVGMVTAEKRRVWNYRICVWLHFDEIVNAEWNTKSEASEYNLM